MNERVATEDGVQVVCGPVVCVSALYGVESLGRSEPVIPLN